MRRRLVALAIVVCLVVAALLLVGLLVLGPHLERGSATRPGRARLTAWVWWTAQWPVLLVVAPASRSRSCSTSGPDVEERRLADRDSGRRSSRWSSGSRRRAALAVYSARFGSYEKTWGTLSAVVVTLLWLWLGGAALLFGAEIDAEIEASRREAASET